MSLVKLNGAPVEWLELYLPWSGAWPVRARVDLEADDPLPIGPMTLVFDDGDTTIEYVGTILESTATDGTGSIVAVGGVGGLRKRIDGADFAHPPPRIVAASILAACGETLGDTTTIDGLPLIAPSYQRLAGRGDRQLDALCALIAARWYMGPSGSVSFEIPQWPTYQGDAFVVEFANTSGEIHAEPSIADIMPGMVVEGVRIASVRYLLADDGLRAMLGTVPT